MFLHGRGKIFIRWEEIDHISYHEYEDEIHIYGQGTKCSFSLVGSIGSARFARMVKSRLEDYIYLDAIEKFNELASLCGNDR